MTMHKSYAIWNNKGGVGKSTIAFHLASRYAELHSDENVLVVDLCPQANVSMMLLGGGTSGENVVFKLCEEESPRTVVGYLAEVLSAPGAPSPVPSKFLLNVNSINSEIPANVHLLCGDGNLEPMAPLISERADQKSIRPGSDAWKDAHLVIRQFISNLVASSDKRWVAFIDTNPSFSIYTEIAICSADELIVPINADDSSRVAVKAMFTLLHGSTPPHPVYGSYTFAAKAAEKGLAIPKVHLIVGNRFTQHKGAATAFRAMSDAAGQALYDQFAANPARFTTPIRKVSGVKSFTDTYSEELRDFNTAGVVAAHLGMPVAHLKQQEYNVHNSSVRINARDVNNCRDALDHVIRRL